LDDVIHTDIAPSALAVVVDFKHSLLAEEIADIQRCRFQMVVVLGRRASDYFAVNEEAQSDLFDIRAAAEEKC
jgi:hypothetical protein